MSTGPRAIGGPGRASVKSDSTDSPRLDYGRRSTGGLARGGQVETGLVDLTVARELAPRHVRFGADCQLARPRSNRQPVGARRT
jgi:hypothetical protein